jgi:outer membrane protein OmpA-like peptidoglycan-associated protein
LTDGEEVNRYGTDPLNPDTDYDMLSDGAEVLTHSTDPLDADTDDGGVTDGHEVIEDYTDPLDPSDDLLLYTLNIEFDYDKAIIRSEYFPELDVIVKVLQRDTEATAKVEGHADKRAKSSREYNIDLSKRRAQAVVDYLVNVGGLDASRFSATGFGFDRPIAPNDTEENMQRNRRTEVYIRRGAQQIDLSEGMPIDPDDSTLDLESDSGSGM